MTSIHLILALLTASPAQAAPERVEVAVETVMAPARGYDDNDNVQVVLYGMLPNACYRLEKHTVEKTPTPGRFKVRQFATRDHDGICAEHADLPDFINMAVPFTQELSVGQLNAGTYSFEFLRGRDRTGIRVLHVAPAPTPRVDSMPYAAVSGAQIADVLPETSELQVTLTGVLNSTCTQLADTVKIEKVDDVFVVMPTIRVEEGTFCAQVLTPFERKVNLGRTKPGRYLVHVRSMNGRAVNRAVEVMRAN